MNKQRFLAELQRLLVFMTEEDKSTVIRCYSEIFDSVGEAGEEALLSELGSPTKAAIGVSRGYEPGNIKNLPKPEDVSVLSTPEKEHKRANEVPVVDMPSFDLPALDERTDETPEEDADLPGNAVTPDAELPEPKKTPEPETAARVLPPVIGVPIFVLVMLALGVPVALLAVAIMAVLLVPGCAGMLAAFLIGVGALWCAGYMADMLLMAGCGLIVLALGVLLLWTGIWAAIKLGGAYAAGVRFLCGQFLGRKVEEDA